jgi:hypothetical protein
MSGSKASEYGLPVCQQGLWVKKVWEVNDQLGGIAVDSQKRTGKGPGLLQRDIFLA